MHDKCGRPAILSPNEEKKLVSFLNTPDNKICTPKFNEKLQELAVERGVKLKRAPCQVKLVSRRTRRRIEDKAWIELIQAFEIFALPLPFSRLFALQATVSPQPKAD